MKKLAQKLKRRRLELGYTQQQVAVKMSSPDSTVSRSTIAKIESGKVNVNSSTLFRIFAVLEVEIELKDKASGLKLPIYYEIISLKKILKKVKDIVSVVEERAD